MPKNLRYLGLAAIVVIGFAIRLIGIEKQSLWSDEGLTLLIAQRQFATLFLSPADPTPGLYYAFHKFFIGPDPSLVIVRSISLVAGTFTIGAVFAAARASRLPAAAAAILAALSFSLVDYSQEARAYSLLVLLVVLSGWAFIWWDHSRRWAALLCFAALIILSFYTHFVSVFWIGPIIAVSIWRARGDSDSRRKLGLVLTLIAVLAIPEINRLINYHRPSFSWLNQAPPTEAIISTAYVLLPFGYFENGHWQLGRDLTAMASLICYGGIGWRAYVHRGALRNWGHENQAAASVLVIWLFLPIAIWLFGYVVTPVFLPRTILIGVPGFLMALSLLLSLEHRLALPLVIGLYALNLAFTGTTRAKEDWRSVVEGLETNVRDGDVILLCPGWKAAALRHAVSKPINAPLLIVRHDGIVLMEPKLGSQSRWAKTYLENLERTGGLTAGQVALARAQRTWHVTSDCKRR